MTAHVNLSISFLGDALPKAAYILNCVANKSVSTTPYELWYVTKPSLDHLHLWGLSSYVHNPTHQYVKLDPNATKIVFINYPAHFKGHVMYGQHPNGGITEIDSHNVNFLEDEFSSNSKIKKDLELYEL